MPALARGNSVAFTFSVASLASDTNLLAGYETDWVTPSSCVDHLVAGKITTGTSPTASRKIEIWACGLLNDVDGSTPVYPDVFDGTAGAETITSADIKRAILRNVRIIGTNNTSDRIYPWGPVSILEVFGQLPLRYCLFAVHNTGVNLNSTAGNHAAHYTPVTLS